MENKFPILVWNQTQKQIRLIQQAQDLLGGDSFQVIKINADEEQLGLARAAFKLGQLNTK